MQHFAATFYCNTAETLYGNSSPQHSAATLLQHFQPVADRLNVHSKYCNNNTQQHFDIAK